MAHVRNFHLASSFMTLSNESFVLTAKFCKETTYTDFNFRVSSKIRWIREKTPSNKSFKKKPKIEYERL